MKKSTAFWFGTSCMLFGIIIGFLTAPFAKGGISMGNNCGNHYYHTEEEE